MSVVPKRAPAAIITSALLAATFGGACIRRASGIPPPRLVLLYATCTLNRGHLGAYDRAVPYTPGITAFARGATVFLRHQTETDQSGPAYASILSGAQADRHGVYGHPGRLRDDLYLLAEAFADAGYETHFWSGHPMASADLNYGQGVRPENVHVRRPGAVDIYRLTANDAEFAAILARLRADPSYRAFVQVNFTITHSPYTVVDPRAVADLRREYPAEWPDLSDADLQRFAHLYTPNYLRLQWDFPAFVRERRLSPADVRGLALTLELYYKVSVRLLDHCFARLIETIRAAGLLEESLVAFTADHGETLYREHTLFKWTHGGELTPDTIEVPLVLRVPGGRAPGTYPGVSRSIDVYPTLAGLAGVRVPRDRGIQGTDLSPALLGRAPAPGLRAFSRTSPHGPDLVAQFRDWHVARFHPSTDVGLIWTAVRDGDTYVRRRREPDGHWRTDAFDLAGDPGASRDVFDAASRRHRDLAREVGGYQALLVNRYPEHQREQALHETEVRERLRSLGYIQ